MKSTKKHAGAGETHPSIDKKPRSPTFLIVVGGIVFVTVVAVVVSISLFGSEIDRFIRGARAPKFASPKEMVFREPK